MEAKRLNSDTHVIRSDQGSYVVVIEGNAALIDGADNGTQAIEEAQRMFPYKEAATAGVSD